MYELIILMVHVDGIISTKCAGFNHNYDKVVVIIISAKCAGYDHSYGKVVVIIISTKSAGFNQCYSKIESRHN